MVKNEQDLTAERLYNPGSVDEAYKLLRVGQKIKVQYVEVGTKGRIIRKGIIKYKVYCRDRSFFVLETGKTQGKYRMCFHFTDMMIGKIKVWEVGG